MGKISYLEFHLTFMGLQFYWNDTLHDLDKWEVYELYCKRKVTWVDLVNNRGEIRSKDKGGWKEGKRIRLPCSEI